MDFELVASLLSYPIQVAWKAIGETLHGESSQLITLDIHDISHVEQDCPLPPGVAKADRKTLEALQRVLPSWSINQVEHFDFGGSFRWSLVKHVENFTYRIGPEDEFLDSELEDLRKALLSACEELVKLAGSNTEMVPSSAKDEVRRWPHCLDGNYREFRKQADEVNAAAEKVSDLYLALIRKALKKLALSDTGKTEQS